MGAFPIIVELYINSDKGPELLAEEREALVPIYEGSYISAGKGLKPPGDRRIEGLIS